LASIATVEINVSLAVGQNMPDEEYEKKWGKGPHLTVDAVIHWRGKYLLIKRKDNGMWALPGGFVNPGERLLSAAVREATEETEIQISPEFHIKMLLSYFFLTTFIQDRPDRDPRSHIVSVVHVFDIAENLEVHIKAGDDAAHAEFVKLDSFLGFKNSTQSEFKSSLYADHGDTLLRAHRLILQRT